MRPWQIRGRRFRFTGFGRRGFEPDDVQDFLDRVADDLSRLYDDLAASREETARAKAALNQRRSRPSRMTNSAGHY